MWRNWFIADWPNVLLSLIKSSMSTLCRWCFDVELVYLCKLFQIPMIEISVNWSEIPGSKVNLLSIPNMLWEMALMSVGYRTGMWKIQSWILSRDTLPLSLTLSKPNRYTNFCNLGCYSDTATEACDEIVIFLTGSIRYLFDWYFVIFEASFLQNCYNTMTLSWFLSFISRDQRKTVLLVGMCIASFDFMAGYYSMI